ncbi:hypothetical protein OOK13_09380 [Streptomyces sp. NBC_00378]|uniref:hypothetical protein n=1 Tax=unclassified Streptomyces TaxID=2593676 RepID=UPI002256866C|nr:MULTISPECIES: hypothetical protein [unclassified Streptomyces]MCX5108741.1 hypothetical protein [Streptomyces sp. NBC_00378]
MSAVAIDIGSRYARIARVGAHGAPELVELPGAVPGEGLPVPAGEDGGRDAALRAAYAAYVGQHGVPDRLVIVAPRPDRSGPAGHGADASAGLHGTGRTPPLSVLSTPHAVLALLRHAGTATAGRYVVCDLGAAAAEVSVCVVTAGAVAVAGCARHAPADGYGAGFEAALLAEAGLPCDEAGRRVLAGLRAEDGAALRLDLALDSAGRNPDRYDATAVHRVAGRNITAGTVRLALRRLAAGLDLATAEALDGAAPAPAPAPAEEASPAEEAARAAVGGLVAVGGTARFAPLLRHLTGGGWPLVPLPAGTDPALAAVYGAALVAAGLADPADRYPYAVCVGAHRTVAGRPENQELLVCGAGLLEPGGAAVFAEAGGERLRVRTGPAGAAAGRPVEVRVRDPEGAVSVPVRTLALPGGAEDDRFHLGVRLAVDGTARLVLRPLDAGAPAEFPLGELPTDLRTDPKGVRL